MATSSEITASILTSINTALQQTNLTQEDRASLINQFEQVTEMIRSGYQFSDANLEDLPTTMTLLVQSQIDTLIADYISSIPYTSLSFTQDDATHFKLNGVKESFFSGYVVGSSSFYYDIPVPDDTGVAGLFKVEAILSHHSLASYGCFMDSWFTFRGVDELDKISLSPDISSSHNGSWSVSKPNSTTLRIEHIAGSNSGTNSHYFIKVTTRNV